MTVFRWKKFIWNTKVIITNTYKQNVTKEKPIKASVL